MALANVTARVPRGRYTQSSGLSEKVWPSATTRAGTANVDRPQFAHFQKIGAARFLVVRQRNGFAQRHHAANGEAVEVGEMAGEGTGHKEVGKVKGIPQFLGGQSRNVLGPRGAADGVGEHGSIITKKLPDDKCHGLTVAATPRRRRVQAMPPVAPRQS